MKKAVLFDVDGTLIDSWDFVFKAIKYSLDQHGHAISDQEIKQAMGRPLLEFYKFILPKTDWLLLANTHRQFQQGKFNLAKPFPKVKKTLKKLKAAGFSIAAISNRGRSSLVTSLGKAKLLQFIDLTVSAEDVKNPKPDAEHILTALDYFNIQPINAFMVGDTDHDILAGKSAGVKTIGATYGFFGKEIKKYDPDFVIDSIEQILKILK